MYFFLSFSSVKNKFFPSALVKLLFAVLSKVFVRMCLGAGNIGQYHTSARIVSER